MLPVCTKIYNIVINGVIDTSPDGFRAGGALLLGTGDETYGVNEPESMTALTISNIVCDSNSAIVVEGFLQDSCISNVVNNNPNCSVIRVNRTEEF